MPKEPPQKGKPPAVPEQPSGSLDVTSSQVVSTRDLDQPPPRPPRRSSTHGVSWYASEDDDELAPPRRSRKKLFVGVLVGVLALGGAAAAFVWSQSAKAPAVSAPVASVADAAPAAALPPDAAPARMAHLTLTSTPAGADFTLDGKPVGKAPVELDVPEKSTVVIEAALADHAPWREEVAVSRQRQQVTARLVALAADAGVPAVADAGAAAPPAKVTTKKSTTKKKAVPKKKKTKKRSTRK